jgi:hypothetical protein
MTWRTAFTNLASIPVSGIATSYDLDDLPNVLPAAQLPALVPSFPDTPGMLSEPEYGLSTLTYDGGAWVTNLYVDHVLYWSPAWSDMGLMAVLPDMITAVDAYLNAVSADGTLDGALGAALEVLRVTPGVMEYAGVKFYGVRFRHLWRRVIG